MRKNLFSAVSVFLIVLALAGCTNKTSNKSLQKLLKNDQDFKGIEISSVKILAENEVEDKTKAVLFSAKRDKSSPIEHHIVIVNQKNDDAYPLEVAYEPLELLQNEILLNRPQEMNITYFNKVSEKIKSDGEDFFDSESNSSDFLCEVTGENGIISTSTAQDIIISSAKEKSDFTNLSEFSAIFEENNANPLCYISKGIESVYIWDWLPESQYLTFMSSSDRDAISNAKDEHGPAYEEQEVWISYDLSGTKSGIYKTKSELIKAVSGEDVDLGEEDPQPSGVLKFVTVSDNPPFSYVADGVLTGADVDIAKAIANELKMELETSTMASSSAIKNMGNGNYHFAMGNFTTDTSGKNISFSDNYYGDYVIILGKTNKDINGKICTALAKLKGDGTINNIIEKHNAHKSEPTAENADTDTISYRVRKSANDSSSQIGAFSSLENAKKEANNHKDEGYKVYDMNGTLVYTP